MYGTKRRKHGLLESRDLQLVVFTTLHQNQVKLPKFTHCYKNTNNFIGERFYLRTLLIAVRGPTSFENLRTINGVVVNGVVHPTFKDACRALGLLENDGEWLQCLREASVMQTGHQLRQLFVMILKECSPVKPEDLWDKFKTSICDDLQHKLS